MKIKALKSKKKLCPHFQDKNFRSHSSEYVLKQYPIYFNEKLAKKYLPIIFENNGYSGDPFGVYYRIVHDPKKNIYCIQYYYYWKKQKCLPPHVHDYEPIFVYLDPHEEFPIGIVNGGYSDNPITSFHKVELRPNVGRRSSFLQSRLATITKQPFYPFGKNETSKKRVWYKSYPLKGNRDLTFQGKYRPKFGLKVCSNVFSGATSELRGRCLSAPLRKLTDKVLKKWYFHHYNSSDEMPFGHDVASPFTFPYINYRDARPHLE